MKGQLTMAHEWVNMTLPALYMQHIADKIDVVTPKNMTLHQLNKLILMSASITYTDKL